MPNNDFPLISDASKTTQEITGWWKNATERALLGSGTQRVRGQWIRKINLTVYGANNTGIDLSQLRINFNINKATNTTPNFFYGKIYNLAPETVKKIRQFKRVQLQAGYQTDQYGIVFDGTIVLFVEGKENPTDTYLEIFAGDGDTPHNYGVILQKWPAKTLPSQKVKDAVQAMGLKQGYIKLEGERPSVRPSTYVGQAVNLIRDHTNAYLSDFFIDDGVAVVLPWAGYLPGVVVELSPTTGLVGIPKVTPQGIECQCLLNPRLRIGGLIKIDTKRLSGIPYVPGSDNPYNTPGGVQTVVTGPGGPASGAAPQFKFGAAGVSPSGTYKIFLLDHLGDTHGQPWYSSMVCMATDASGKVMMQLSGSAFGRSSAPSQG